MHSTSSQILHFRDPPRNHFFSDLSVLWTEDLNERVKSISFRQVFLTGIHSTRRLINPVFYGDFQNFFNR